MLASPRLSAGLLIEIITGGIAGAILTLALLVPS